MTTLPPRIISTDAADFVRLSAFLKESLKTEGIYRNPTLDEVQATSAFLEGPLTIETVLTLQAVYTPGFPLRERPNMNVRVGSHLAPLGGPHIGAALQAFLKQQDGAYQAHIAFEKLHPFMDGNGRTGRAVWAWMMLDEGEDPFAIGFLHRFYYQALATSF